MLKTTAQKRTKMHTPNRVHKSNKKKSTSSRFNTNNKQFKRNTTCNFSTTTSQYSQNQSENDEIITANRRSYKPPQLNKAYVGICLDGTSPEYINAAMDAGKMPNLKKITSPKEFTSLIEMMKAKEKKAQEGSVGQPQSFFEAQGVVGIAAGAFPTYTNPNNVSIITGVSPLHHGICGNFYYDQINDQNVMMTSPSLIRSDSILAQLYKNDPDNTRITIITSKDKLKTLLLHQLPQNYVGSELPNLHHKSSETTPKTNIDNINPNVRAVSIEALNLHPKLGHKYTKMVNDDINNDNNNTDSIAPSIYDPMNSVYTLQLGHAMYMNDKKVDNFKGKNIFYLSTTDYVQHSHAPGTDEANNFMYELDKVIGKFHNDGAIVGITADHGMNEKAKYSGEPDITYLGSELDSINVKGRVILPITDPYTAHHGALGGFATIYLDKSNNNSKDEFEANLTKTYQHLRSLKGCYSVIGKDDAKRGLDLPEDRIGDIVVLGHRNSVFGTRPQEHDLTQLHGKILRSHGSLEEALVPLIYNRPVTGEFKKKFGQGKIRNFDLFHGMFNGLDIE